MTEEFATKLAKLPKVCPHFHLSLQSGAKETLKRMNRHYTPGEYLQGVEELRRAFDEPAITTDVIVGFPGETEEEFNETYKFVKEIGFSKIHVFKYSKREGTPAYDYENQVDSNIKNERSAKLISLGDKLTEEFISKYIVNDIF